MLRKIATLPILITVLASCGGSIDPTPDIAPPTPIPVPPPAPAPPPPPPPNPSDIDGFTLVWQDEFDGTSIDATSWNFETGDGTAFDLPPGWGNDELQIYTSDADNASIGDDAGESVLMITAKEDGAGGYTSARMTTEDKVSMRYGKIVARIKLPETQGMWPALWMLGDNIDEVSWPGSGEIDILELVGHVPEETFHTIHYVDANKAYKNDGKNFLNTIKFSEDYHVFTLDWTPESLTFSVDGVEAHMITIDDGMKEFQRSFHVLLNIAVGGRLPGVPDATTVFPQTMYVDYLRIYELDGFSPEAPPVLVLEDETVGGSAGEADAAVAILEGFSSFGPASFARFGAGGEPDWFESNDAVNGDKSVLFAYPGGNWGGAWVALDTPIDFASFSDSDLVFALKRPAVVTSLEVKIEGESSTNDGSIFLESYTSTDLGNGWEEFKIPLADFVADGLALTMIEIPFALWNPKATDGTFPQVNILFDAVRIE